VMNVKPDCKRWDAVKGTAEDVNHNVKGCGGQRTTPQWKWLAVQLRDYTVKGASRRRAEDEQQVKTVTGISKLKRRRLILTRWTSSEWVKYLC